MSAPSVELLVTALTKPTGLPGLPMPEWDLLVRQARRADMLARIEAKCRAGGVLNQLPGQPRMHLESAAVVATRQRREVRWEVQLIESALAPLGIEFILLKGAAYAICNLDAAEGRMMSDVDILVPQENLPEVESYLMKRGWVSSATSAYDQRYYRTWMHELPPMRHIHRNTVIDVHHAILPLTSRSHPSTAALFKAALPIDGSSKVKVLAPIDMVLHSASHLFHEGEFEQGFRGLVDLDSLLRAYCTLPNFWERLVRRSAELELSIPLFYALRYASSILGTPVPQSTLEASAERSGHTLRPTWLMDRLFSRALLPDHASTSDRWTPMARGLLYIRGHWLRMPPWLLTVHLARKALVRSHSSERQDA